MKLIVNNIQYDTASGMKFSGDLVNAQKQQVTLKKNVPGQLFSINGVQTQLGDFSIFGSSCVSVIQKDINSESDIALSQHAIGIFNGCQMCDSCQQLAESSSKLAKMELTSLAIKNSVLYTVQDAQQLWTAMKGWLKQNQPATSSNCPSYNQDSQLPVKVSYLLYRYRALVNLWNYLVRAGNNGTLLRPVDQDFAGFLISFQKAVDLCSLAQTQSHKVDLYATIEQQTIPSYQQKELSAQMCITLIPVQDSTKVVNSSTPVQSSDSVTRQNRLINIALHYRFDFSQVQKSTAMATIKLLPVIVNKYTHPWVVEQVKIPMYAEQEASQNDYMHLRKVANRLYDLSDSQIQLVIGTQKILWKIDWKWVIPGLNGDFSQTKYYSTVAGMLPQD